MTVTRLLDLTRLVSRAGLVQTGVDRVEFAYLNAVAKQPNGFGLVRTALGFILLDQSGMRALCTAIETDTWGKVDLLSRANRRLTDAAKRGQSLARRHALARCRPNGLGKMLARHMPGGFCYYNVGHSNLTQRVLLGVSGAGGHVSVLIHDTIPLDWPDMQRVGTSASFARKLQLTDAYADRIVVSSNAVADDLGRHLNGDKTVVAAPLGVTLAEPKPIPPDLDTDRPYFVALGTIEPRKNHALLLDVWEGWNDPAQLFICGRRGWNNEAVFARLDAGVAGVRECPELDDGQIATLLTGARALLFPTFAEGYGLPPIEALAHGTPVVVSDIPALREVLGDAAVYLDPTDRNGWEKTIKNMSLAKTNGTKMTRVPPDWDTHFKLVFTDEW